MKIVKCLLVFLFIQTAFAADKAPDVAKLNADLLYKAQFGRGAEVAILLEQGADINAMSKEGVPAFSIAAARRDDSGIEVMQTLLDKGGNIDIKDSQGQTPLFYAVKNDNKKAVQWLLEHKAQYYITDNNGDIARNIAYRERYDELFKLMDDFVEKQRQDIQKQYDDYNQAIKQRNEEVLRQYSEQEKALLGEKQRLVDERMERDASLTRAQALAAVEAETRNETLQSKYDSPEFAAALRELALNACSFEYWSYVQRVGVKTEPSSSELDKLINTYQQQVLSQQNAMMANYQLKQNYVRKIITPSQQAIYKQLKAYGSNATLVSNNIGTRTDAKDRCGRVAGAMQVGTSGLTPVEDMEKPTLPKKQQNQRQTVPAGGSGMRMNP